MQVGSFAFPFSIRSKYLSKHKYELRRVGIHRQVEARRWHLVFQLLILNVERIRIFKSQTKPRSSVDDRNTLKSDDLLNRPWPFVECQSSANARPDHVSGVFSTCSSSVASSNEYLTSLTTSHHCFPFHLSPLLLAITSYVPVLVARATYQRGAFSRHSSQPAKQFTNAAVGLPRRIH